MRSYLDAILVGLLTALIVAAILAIRPGYTPVEVSDEVITQLTEQPALDGEE